MKAYLTIFLSLFILITSCNENIIQPDEESFAGKLEIKTEKSEYHSEDFNSDFAFVSATVVNTSTDTFYSSLGDFYGGIDQDNFFMAGNTDGYFEVKSEMNSWEELSRPLLIEGSRVVRILPSKKYKLTASAFLDSSNFGRCRLKINYYRSNSINSADTLEDISNIFLIYKK
jgi:hypothetical protein